MYERECLAIGSRENTCNKVFVNIAVFRFSRKAKIEQFAIFFWVQRQKYNELNIIDFAATSEGVIEGYNIPTKQIAQNDSSSKTICFILTEYRYNKLFLFFSYQIPSCMTVNSKTMELHRIYSGFYIKEADCITVTRIEIRICNSFILKGIFRADVSKYSQLVPLNLCKEIVNDFTNR